MMPRRFRQDGFTLLEVMIAVAIMVVAFTAILTSQSSSIQLVIKSKEINTATWLARNKMLESEHLFEGKPFEELEKEKEENFPEPFGQYKWRREVKEVKFPDFSLPTKEETGIPEPLRIVTQTLTRYFNQTIRELVVTVEWRRGTAEQKVQVSTYLVDLSKEFDFSI